MSTFGHLKMTDDPNRRRHCLQKVKLSLLNLLVEGFEAEEPLDDDRNFRLEGSSP